MHHFDGVVWSDQLLDHLVLNTGRWDVESAARLVVAALRCVPAASS